MGKLLSLFHNGSAGNSAVSLELPGTPVAVYSVVKTPGWSGSCVRIARASDSAQTDIGFTSSNLLDIAAALAFANGSVITIVKFYDQSGNGYDATASTNHPTIISGNGIQGVQGLTFCASNGVGNSSLVIPAELALSTQDFTACIAYAGGGGWLNFNSLFGIGTQVNLWWEKFVGVIQGSSLFTAGNKNQFSPRQAQVDSVILSGSSSQRILRNNGNSQTVASAYASATTAGAYIGGSTVVTASNIEVFAFVLYASELVVGDKVLVETSFTNAFKANTPFTTKLIFDGDSITAGFTIGAYIHGYPRIISTALGTSYGIYNLAVPGQTIQTCYTNRANVTNRRDTNYAQNYNIIFGGTNDLDNRASGTIVGYGTTVWTSYTLPYIQAMLAAGFNKVFVGTAIARNWAGSAQDKLDKEAERLVYNQLIRDNAVAEGYIVLDFAALTQMSDYANTTYSVDAVHPTKLGYSVMGTYAAPIISSGLMRPYNTVAPAVTGSTSVGNVLTSTSGTWSGKATITYAYQWYKDGVAISGQTTNTYTTVAGDLNASITCVVTATNGDGSTAATSNVIVVADFSPVDIANIALWLDASDLSSITQVAGAVSQWSDKSGANRHATQATGANQPMTGTRNINGVNVLDFDGSNDGFDLASPIPVTNGYTVFAICEMDTLAAQNVIVGSATSTEAIFQTRTSSKFAWVSNGTAERFASAAIATATPYIVAAQSKNGAGVNEHRIYATGITPTIGTASPAYGTTNGMARIGSLPTNPFNGKIGLILVYTRLLTTAEINQVGSWLAGEWGISWTTV